MQRKTASWAVLSTDQVHCDSGGVGEAYFGGGTKLTVLETGHDITKPTVKVFQPSKNECRNEKDKVRKKTIVCVASGFYPDHVSVSWQMDGENVTKGVATDNAALREDKFYRITSRLRVSAKDWEKEKRFTCIVRFFNGTDYEDVSAFITGEEAEGDKVMDRGKFLMIQQSAKLSYCVFIVKSSLYGAFVAFLVWKLQGSTRKHNY